MPILTTALTHLLVILAIGIIIGLVFNRYGRSWFRRHVAVASGAGDVTYALVGIAGSFTGFHLGVVLGLLPSPSMLFAAAIIGAALTIWIWQGR